MEVDTKADLLEWLRLKIEWFETDPDVEQGGISALYSCGIYDEARKHLIGLNFIDSLDALGSEPPCVVCVPAETNRSICELVKRKLQDLSSHLAGIQPLNESYESITPGEFAKQLGANTATINKYAKEARIKTPPASRSNFRYTPERRLKVLYAIINTGTEGDMLEKARSLRKELEKKSKSRK